MHLRSITLIGIIVSIVTGIALGVLVHLMTRSATPAAPAATLNAALRQVSENYVEEISEAELLGHAIKGMMHRLDDHSNFLDENAFHKLQESTTGQFGGIGIELGMEDGYFTVIAPIDNTPAHQAGLKSGDRITRLDNTTVKGMLLVDLIDGLRGAPGSKVRLHVKRPGISQLLEFNLERAVIEVASVTGRLLEPGYGYVRIAAFQDTTGADLQQQIDMLKQQADAPLKGLVIDLRNNPGGTLQSSVEVADHFLDHGLIVYTEGRLNSSFVKYRATKGDLLHGTPIVVLINGGSASASEIVAGALQDHGRAMLMGVTSYGKGSVQSVLPLNEEQALKITTAYYFTPKGRSIHNTGIDPDVPFDGEEALLLDEALQLLKSAHSKSLHARL